MRLGKKDKFFGVDRLGSRIDIPKVSIERMPIDSTFSTINGGSMQIKSGWQTSEFWLTLLTNVVTIVQTLHGVVPPDVAAIIIASANGIYGIIRAIAKKGQNGTPISQ